MQTSLIPKKVEAMEYIASGDYRKVGNIRPDLHDMVEGLISEGLVKIKYGPGCCARKVLTQRGIYVLSNLT